MSYSVKEFRGIQDLAVKHEPWSDNLRNLCALWKLYLSGRIETVTRKGTVIAYAETWKVPKSHLEAILNHHFNVFLHTFDAGPVLWVANVTIAEEHRGDFQVIRELKEKVFSKNQDAEWIGWDYAGTRQRRRNYRIKLFKQKAVGHGQK